eukprot:6213454-Pleurochrysis_carterae.AAC.4
MIKLYVRRTYLTSCMKSYSGDASHEQPASATAIATVAAAAAAQGMGTRDSQREYLKEGIKQVWGEETR